MPTHHPHNAPRPDGDGSAVGLGRDGIQWVVVMLSLAFLVVGIASAAAALWVGAVVHAVLGVAGWPMSRSAAGSRSYLVWGGLLYLVLTLTGVLVVHAAVQAAVAVAMIIGGLTEG